MNVRRQWLILVLTGLATFRLGVFVAPLDKPQSHRRAPVGVMVSSQQSHWPVLLSFLDRDLSKLDPQSEAALRHAIDTVTGGLDPDLSPSLKPRVFQLVSNSTGEKRLLLVEINNLGVIKGASYMRVLLFDVEGQLLYSKTSDVDMELFVTVRIGKSKDVPGDVLATETITVFDGRRSSHFYRLVGNEIIPIERKGRFHDSIKS